MNLRRVNDEVFVAEDAIVRLGDEAIEFVKQEALKSPRRRARICAHKANEDALHEMLIAIARESYIHPHRHIGKAESFHIVQGEVDVVMLDEAGAITDVIELGAIGSGRNFFYRLANSVFHTLVIRTPLLVVHEVTNGPFTKDRTVLAPFAPTEDDSAAARAYMEAVVARVRARAGRRPA